MVHPISQSNAVRRHYYWLDIISVLLGCVLLSEFYALLGQRFFTVSGFQARLDNLLSYSFYGWHGFLSWLSMHATIFAPICAIVLSLTSIFMILLLATRVTAWITVFIFLVYYLSHLHVPGTWLFEYLMPLLISLCIAIANLPRNFNFKLWHKPRLLLQIAAITFVSFLLWYVLLLSENTNGMLAVQRYAAISFALLLLFLVIFDRFRKDLALDNSKLNNKLVVLPWMDVITVIIGAMLVFQVYEDHLLQWFTVSGYKSLTEAYQLSTHAPHWMIYFINLAGEHAKFFMPIQLVTESACALMLVILVLRTPFTIIAFLIFAMFSYIEFGTPASRLFPQSGTTWTWELLFTACVTFFLIIFNIRKTLEAKPDQRFKLGTNLFGETRFVTRILVAVVSGIALFLLVFIGATLTKQNEILAIESGLTLFFYLLLLGVIDFARPRV